MNFSILSDKDFQKMKNLERENEHLRNMAEANKKWLWKSLTLTFVGSLVLGIWIGYQF